MSAGSLLRLVLISVSVALALLTPAALASPSGVVTSPASPRPDSGLEPHPGELLPLGARFRTSDGRDVALGDVLEGGKPTLLVLAYNRCTMLCSLVLRSVARLMTDFELRPGEDFSLVTLSIDPSDTVLEASRMQASLSDAAGFGAEPERWTFLVGEKPAIDAVADALGFRYRWDQNTEQYAHPAVLFTLAPDARISGYFDGLAPERAALRAALAGDGPRRAAALLQGAILDCFRFDTSTSRYGSAIVWLLRGGATSLVLGLVGLMWWLARSRRLAPGGER